MMKPRHLSIRARLILLVLAVVLPAAHAQSGAPLTEAQKFEQLVAANAAKRQTPPSMGG